MAHLKVNLPLRITHFLGGKYSQDVTEYASPRINPSVILGLLNKIFMEDILFVLVRHCRTEFLDLLITLKMLSVEQTSYKEAATQLRT
jgi:hypothetical protein